jgi:hypothetical protein
VLMISLKDESFTENDIIDPTWAMRYLLNHLSRDNISAEQVVKVVRKMCKRTEGVRIRFKASRGLKNCFTVSGTFDCEELKPIELEISGSSYSKVFKINKKFYYALIADIADTLCHESIHRYQYRIRGFESDYDNNDEHDYYADPDEIFAYGVNIAHNLYRQFGPKTLSTLSNYRLITSRDYYLADYYSLFYNQAVFNKLMKMIYQNVLAIEEGKICHRDRM